MCCDNCRGNGATAQDDIRSDSPVNTTIPQSFQTTTIGEATTIGGDTIGGDTTILAAESAPADTRGIPLNFLIFLVIVFLAAD